jgi:hypothetical protein
MDNVRFFTNGSNDETLNGILGSHVCLHENQGSVTSSMKGRRAVERVNTGTYGAGDGPKRQLQRPR